MLCDIQSTQRNYLWGVSEINRHLNSVSLVTSQDYINSVSKQMGSACVMIGIGGTGLAALRRVKKEVYLHLEPDDPDAAVPEYSKIAFLGIDTDTTDLTVVNPDITDLQVHEQWSVNVPRLGEMLANPENKTDPCLNWLSIPLEMDGDQGAGGNRQAGRFCLFKKALALRIKLCKIINQVKTKTGRPNVQVHIFAGISGGTGSGCFLDVCYILRDILKGTGSTVYGYFFFPDAQLYRPNIKNITAIENYKRNGYAALRELDYCMSFPSSGGCFRANYSFNFSVESKEAPVDQCHLISVADTSSITEENGFNYCLSDVAEYVLTYLADVQASSVQEANDTKELTTECFRINTRQALGIIRPSVGAECNYNIVSSLSAELPLTFVGTNLVSVTCSKRQCSLQWYCTKLICDHFVKKIRCTTNGLIARWAFDANESNYKVYENYTQIIQPSVWNTHFFDWQFIYSNTKVNHNSWKNKMSSVRITGISFDTLKTKQNNDIVQFNFDCGRRSSIPIFRKQHIEEQYFQAANTYRISLKKLIVFASQRRENRETIPKKQNNIQYYISFGEKDRDTISNFRKHLIRGDEPLSHVERNRFNRKVSNHMLQLNIIQLNIIQLNTRTRFRNDQCARNTFHFIELSNCEKLCA